MMVSQAIFTCANVFAFMFANTGVYRLYKYRKIGSGRLPQGSILLIAGLILGVFPKTVSVEDVPNTLHDVAARVTEKDQDPTHEETTTVIEPGIGVGPVFTETEQAIHVPARYSVLLEWEGGQTWLPVDGRLYRKLNIGTTVVLALREQQDVTIFERSQPRLVAGPIKQEDNRLGAP